MLTATCKKHRIEDVMEMLGIFFPFDRFETREEPYGYLITTNEDIDQMYFERIVQGNFRLQYVNTGTTLKFLKKLRDFNPRNWYGEPRYNPDIDAFFVPYIYLLNG